MKNLFIRIVTLAVCILISGCAAYQPNPRLEESEDLYDLIQTALADSGRSDELLFLLIFFGGGGTSLPV